ncbi:MAG TPA: NAD(+)/NADH kinase, partial [bacterium]|nr:NAD(+)/NADH kinase [bacterium]
MRKINNILVYFRKDGKRVDEQRSLMKLFLKYADLYGVSVVDAGEEDKKADLVISGGGDGTFLDAARIAFLYDVPVAGINIGHMGFLTEINPDESLMIEKLFKGEFDVNTRMMIDVAVARGGDDIFNYTALNESIIHRETSSGMICFGIDYNDEKLPEY